VLPTAFPQVGEILASRCGAGLFQHLLVGQPHRLAGGLGRPGLALLGKEGLMNPRERCRAVRDVLWQTASVRRNIRRFVFLIVFIALTIASLRSRRTKKLTLIRNALIHNINKVSNSPLNAIHASKQVMALLSALSTDTLTASDLMARVGIKSRSTFRQNYLEPALKQGLITMTIPDKPNSRNQKYRKA